MITILNKGFTVDTVVNAHEGAFLVMGAAGLILVTVLRIMVIT